MDAVERTVRVNERLFRVEVVRDSVRGSWLAAVGEGAAPTRWMRLPLSYDSAEEALAAATSGIMRLCGASACARPLPRPRGGTRPAGGPGSAIRRSPQGSAWA